MKRAILFLLPMAALLAMPGFGQETCRAAPKHFEKALGFDLAYGCLIEDIQAGSLAMHQGLTQGDLLLSLNDKPFRDFSSTKEFSLDTKGAAASDKALIKVLKFDGESYRKNPDTVSFTIHAGQLAERGPILGFKCKGQAVVLSVRNTPLDGTDIRPGDFILQINDKTISSSDVTGQLAENGSRNLPYLDNPLMVDQVVEDALDSKSDKVSIIFGRWGSVVDGKRELQARLVVLPKSELVARDR